MAVRGGLADDDERVGTVNRILALGAVALAAATGLTACSTKDTSQGSGAKEITFLTFETPNLTPQYWDAAIKRVTDKYPDIKVKKLVSPDQDRTTYAKQLLTSGQFPDVMIAVSPAGFAVAGNLYAWGPAELTDFEFPSNGAIKGKVYQLPANTQTIPVVYYNKSLFSQASLSGATARSSSPTRTSRRPPASWPTWPPRATSTSATCPATTPPPSRRSWTARARCTRWATGSRPRPTARRPSPSSTSASSTGPPTTARWWCPRSPAAACW